MRKKKNWGGEQIGYAPRMPLLLKFQGKFGFQSHFGGFWQGAPYCQTIRETPRSDPELGERYNNNSIPMPLPCLAGEYMASRIGVKYRQKEIDWEDR